MQLTERSKVTLLVVLSGGGFSFETKTLLGNFDDRFKFKYIRTDFGGDPGKDGVPSGEDRVVPMFSTVTNSSIIASSWAFLATLTCALSFIWRHRIDAVIGVGCSHLVPVLIAGRLTRRRNIYIETITRTDYLSITGRIVYHFRLADTFIIQWPELQRRYPRSIVGTIL